MVFLPLVLLVACATPAPAFPSHSIEIGHFDEEELTPVQAKFDERVKAGDKKILFALNSHGGEVDKGLDFVKHVKDATKKNHLKIQCAVDWRAYSMGFYFFETACTERYISRGGMLMAHAVWAVTAAGTPKELRNAADQMDSQTDMLLGWTARKMHLTKASLRARVEKGDWFMSPDEAIDYQAVDAVIEPETLPEPYTLEAPKVDLSTLLDGLKGLRGLP